MNDKNIKIRAVERPEIDLRGVAEALLRLVQTPPAPKPKTPTEARHD